MAGSRKRKANRDTPEKSSGVLVLVVGPSGAGKDTLISAAQSRLAGDDRFVFPRRIVSRETTPWEDHQSVTRARFDALAADGAFALSWEAHGLAYALPISINQDIAAGRTVVCNVSRSIVWAAREDYPHVRVLYIDARADVLAGRIASRNRDPAMPSRVSPDRDTFDRRQCDAVIDNSGAIDTATEAFLAALTAAAGPARARSN